MMERAKMVQSYNGKENLQSMFQRTDSMVRDIPNPNAPDTTE